MALGGARGEPLRPLGAWAGAPVRAKPGIKRWTRHLERSLIPTLILAGEPAGVGFVFAGKAITRFSEREQVEYYLLGTFASFT